ncbi:MAG: hypothetical protein LWW81_06025 [Rhodocyclales bacterium]|nr:hypothetical protein [Rhodocyclales bacterium]
MSITEIAFTGLPVTNMKASRSFYDALLAAEPFFVTPDGNLAEYRVGQGILTIGVLGDAFRPSSDGPFVALEVDDFDSEIRRISDIGAKIAVQRVELPTSIFAIVLDPDGNKLMIHKATA